MSEVEVKEYLLSLRQVMNDITDTDRMAEAVCAASYATHSHHKHLRDWWLSLPPEEGLLERVLGCNATYLYQLVCESGLCLPDGGLFYARCVEWGEEGTPPTAAEIAVHIPSITGY